MSQSLSHTQISPSIHQLTSHLAPPWKFMLTSPISAEQASLEIDRCPSLSANLTTEVTPTLETFRSNEPLSYLQKHTHTQTHICTYTHSNNERTTHGKPHVTRIKLWRKHNVIILAAFPRFVKKLLGAL